MRDSILIREFDDRTNLDHSIEGIGEFNIRGNTLSVTREQRHSYSQSALSECIDGKKVDFPLKVRKWKPGDVIRPLGMKGTKKLSDLFTDLKMSKFDKEEAFILCNCDGRIIWVIGHRLSEEFKLEDSSQDFLRLEWNNHVQSSTEA